MTPEAREKQYYESLLELLSIPRAMRQQLRIPRQGFPYAHIVALMSQLPQRKGVKRAYELWKVSKGMQGGSQNS